MNPVDEGPAEFFVHGAGRADDEHRRPIDVGIVNPHWCMEQTDDVMNDRYHRLAARFGVAMGNLHGDLFMIAEDHRWLVFAVVYERIVQAAKTRAGIERDEGNFVLLDKIDDHVRLPALAGFFDCFAHSVSSVIRIVRAGRPGRTVTILRAISSSARSSPAAGS